MDKGVAVGVGGECVGCSPPVRVGVHVRRTDYIEYLRRKTGGGLPQMEYYSRAFDFFRSRRVGRS